MAKDVFAFLVGNIVLFNSGATNGERVEIL